MDWRSCLSDVIKKNDAKPNLQTDEDEAKKQQEEEMELFSKLFEQERSSTSDPKNYNKIPRFYFKLPSDDEVLLQKLREESRAVFLQRKSRELLG